MASLDNITVLFFDVFGTCVMQRGPIADALSAAAKEALRSDSAIRDEVRQKAEQMTYETWFDLGGQWNKVESQHKNEMIAESGTVDWKAIDEQRIASLPKLLAEHGLVIVSQNNDGSSGPSLEPGSLFTTQQLQHLGRTWHRLPPWSDTCRGLDLLNTRFATVALSNTYNDLMKGLVAHSNIPFTEVFTSDLFGSYKPNPKVYLGAAEKMGVKPEECALVAAHLSDLKGAKACGFYAIYVERPLEEKKPELKGEGIPDLVVKEDEGGLIRLAERLGITETK